MKNRNKSTKFPVARIKKIMQKDEEVGKVAQATPVVISKALELFLGFIVHKSHEVTAERGSRKVESYHLKHAVETTEILDFLKDLVEAIPDPSAGGTIDLEAEAESRRRRGKGKRAAAAATTAPSSSSARATAAKAEDGGDEPAPKRRRRKKGGVDVAAAAPLASPTPPSPQAGPSGFSTAERLAAKPDVDEEMDDEYDEEDGGARNGRRHSPSEDDER